MKTGDMVTIAGMTAVQVVGFIERHFALFADTKDGAFPEKVLRGIASQTIVLVTREEGFAVAYKGSQGVLGAGAAAADLMFLYVSPQHRRQGIGDWLVEEVMGKVAAGVPITLTCEGETRRAFFEGRGFVVTSMCGHPAIYQMCHVPTQVA